MSIILIVQDCKNIINIDVYYQYYCDSILLISIIDRVGSPLEINRDAVSSYPENIVNDDEYKCYHSLQQN